MIEETGKVVAIEGDHAWVETIRQTACQSCELKSGCGQQALAKAFGNRLQHIKLENTLGLGEGECVVLGIHEDALLKGSMFVYAMPLVLMIIFSLISEALFGGNDAVAIIAGLSGLVAGFFIIRRQSAKEGYFQRPVMLRAVETAVKFEPGIS